jgi:hypothetical protein
MAVNGGSKMTVTAEKGKFISSSKQQWSLAK